MKESKPLWGVLSFVPWYSTCKDTTHCIQSLISRGFGANTPSACGLQFKALTCIQIIFWEASEQLLRLLKSGMWKQRRPVVDSVLLV